MKLFVSNILLALTWTMLMGTFSPENFLGGFLLGYMLLYLTRFGMGETKYFSKVWQAFSFLAFFLKELVLSNLRVAYDVITPSYNMRPAVLAIPLDVKTPIEITLLANLITLTPGTLSLDISDDRKVLYVHAMFVRDPQEVRDSIKNGFERRVIELLR